MITEEQVREAVARIVYYCDDIGRQSQARGYDADIDMTTLAEWARQELARRESERAERSRPIDAEWLSTCKPDLLFWQKTSEFIEYEFRHQPQPGALKVVVNANGHVGFVVNKSLAACLTTRGQLLDLIAALKGGA